jgi:hypothetical protein
VFDYVLNKLKTNKLPEFVEVWHEGKCGKCGRALTVAVNENAQRHRQLSCHGIALLVHKHPN